MTGDTPRFPDVPILKHEMLLKGLRDQLGATLSTPGGLPGIDDRLEKPERVQAWLVTNRSETVDEGDDRGGEGD